MDYYFNVLMHLLVLGAFCPPQSPQEAAPGARLNAPSGAGCFLPPYWPGRECFLPGVLMHLLVLGAFCQHTTPGDSRAVPGLNAPSGAGCFLTPASGSGVVAPLPGAGAPPAPQAPAGPASTAPI